MINPEQAAAMAEYLSVNLCTTYEETCIAIHEGKKELVQVYPCYKGMAPHDVIASMDDTYESIKALTKPLKLEVTELKSQIATLKLLYKEQAIKMHDLLLQIALKQAGVP